jgi:hypothetical protein
MLAGDVEPSFGRVLVPSHLRFLLVTHQVFVMLGRKRANHPQQTGWVESLRCCMFFLAENDYTLTITSSFDHFLECYERL